MGRLSRIGLRQVQVIGVEVISCATLINGSLVLAHAKVSGGAVDLTVRAKQKALAEAVARAAQQSLMQA